MRLQHLSNTAHTSSRRRRDTAQVLLPLVLVFCLLVSPLAAGPLGGMLNSVGSKIGELAKTGVQATTNLGKEAASKAGEGLKKLGEDVGHRAQEVAGQVVEGAKKAEQAVGSVMGSAVGSAVGGVKKGKEEVEAAVKKLSSVDLGKLADLLKMFSSIGGGGKGSGEQRGHGKGDGEGQGMSGGPQRPGPQQPPRPDTQTPPPHPPQPDSRPDQQQQQSGPQQQQQRDDHKTDLTPPQGDFGPMAAGVRDSLLRLADEQVRSQLFRGFLSAGEFVQDRPACTKLLSECLQTLELAVGTATGVQTGLMGSAVMHQLNTLVKIDRMLRQLGSSADARECVGKESTELKKVLVKLVYYNEEFVANAKSNLGLLAAMAGAALQFQMGAYEESGGSLGQAVKMAASTGVSVGEEALARVDLWRCAVAVMRAKSRQEVEAGSAGEAWRAAVEEARSECLATAQA